MDHETTLQSYKDLARKVAVGDQVRWLPENKRSHVKAGMLLYVLLDE